MLAFGPAPLPHGLVPAAHVLGDVAAAIEELAVRLRDKPRADWDVAELDRLRREATARSTGDDLAARIVRLAREATPAGTIGTVDAGEYQTCVTGAWHAIAPREFLTSGATSGFALPAAIAAHLVHSERCVVCFTDAAGVTAAARELETAARLAAAVVVVVFDDCGAGAPDSMKLARDSGVRAFAADSEGKFAEALGRTLRTGGPAVIAVRP